MVKDSNVDEGTSRVFALKEDHTDVTHEDHYDPVLLSAIPKEDQVNFILKFCIVLHEYLRGYFVFFF